MLYLGNLNSILVVFTRYHIHINISFTIMYYFMNVIFIGRKKESEKVCSISLLAKISISYAKGYLLQEPNH